MDDGEGLSDGTLISPAQRFGAECFVAALAFDPAMREAAGQASSAAAADPAMPLAVAAMIGESGRPLVVVHEGAVVLCDVTRVPQQAAVPGYRGLGLADALSAARHAGGPMVFSTSGAAVAVAERHRTSLSATAGGASS